MIQVYKGVGLILQSPSKVNVGLRVVGRRPDGYHLLESLFWPVDLSDEIEILREKKSSVSISWTEGAPIKSNLPETNQDSVSKMLLANPEIGNWKIKIRKRIPIGAGLGGSSSNAGTVLKFLVDEKRITAEQASKIALSIGADVPFFLNPAPTWIKGIGEIRTPIDLESRDSRLIFHLILLSEPCITKDIFCAFRNSGAPFSDSTNVPQRWNTDSLNSYFSNTGNDLERHAIQSVPLIAKVLDYLRSFGFPYVGLSGSGSTCFAVSNTDADRETISKDLQHFCRKYKCSYIEANTFGA